MSKYLRTVDISAELQKLILEAKKELYIISPYLKLSDQIKELLNDKEREKVDVRIIFGKQQLAPTEMNFLEGLSYIRLYFFKNLHAKCFVNENKMIIASMNLYEFSQQNNREMGILMDTENPEDKMVYDEAMKDINSIIHNSEDFSYVKIPQKENKPIDKTKSNKIFEKDISNSNLKTTKELSKSIGISSRKINEIIVDEKLMYKKGEDWYITKKGKEFGGFEKDGQYGRFVVWPEKSITEMLDKVMFNEI